MSTNSVSHDEGKNLSIQSLSTKFFTDHSDSSLSIWPCIQSAIPDDQQGFASVEFVQKAIET